jgi:hypothetical protein
MRSLHVLSAQHRAVFFSEEHSMKLVTIKDTAISCGGASIIAHKSEITNPNVVYKTCTD